MEARRAEEEVKRGEQDVKEKQYMEQYSAQQKESKRLKEEFVMKTE